MKMSQKKRNRSESLLPPLIRRSTVLLLLFSYRGMPTDCPCTLGCTSCIRELSEASNLIIHLVSLEWEEWVRNDIARSPVLGDTMLFRHDDREVPCRVVKVAICPSSCHTSYLSMLPNTCIYRLRKAKTTQTIPNTSTIRSLYCTPSGGHPAKLTSRREKKCKFAAAHATTSDSVVANFLGVGLFG